MQRKVGLIDVFTQPYEVWTRRLNSQQEALDLALNHGVHPSQAFEVRDKLIAVVATAVRVEQVACRCSGYLSRRH